jgi:hypothetical protein
MADPIAQDAVIERIDDQLRIVAAAIKEMLEVGHSKEDIAKALQFFANELRCLGELKAKGKERQCPGSGGTSNG